MKSNGNSFGPGGGHGECASGPPDASTPLLTTGAPPQPEHWWYLA